MQDWAYKFYSSVAWQTCREAYKAQVNNLCEKCAEKGVVTAGEIVHHKIPLTRHNINNPNLTLSFDNLRLECRACHGGSHSSGVLMDGYAFDDSGDLVALPPHPQK